MESFAEACINLNGSFCMIIEIVLLNSISESQMVELQGLMKQLTPDIDVTSEMLLRTVESPNTHFITLVEDGHILGCVSLCVFESPTGRKGSVEDVVVNLQHRGQGLGRKLMEHVIDYAKTKLAPIDLHLTSNPKRVNANALYKVVGFKQRETNVYKMEIR